jgi:hypothetical protein
MSGEFPRPIAWVARDTVSYPAERNSDEGLENFKWFCERIDDPKHQDILGLLPPLDVFSS